MYKAILKRIKREPKQKQLERKAKPVVCDKTWQALEAFRKIGSLGTHPVVLEPVRPINGFIGKKFECATRSELRTHFKAARAMSDVAKVLVSRASP